MSDDDLLALNDACPDITTMLPKRFLKQVLDTNPDVDRSDIIAVFQQSLGHCKAEVEVVQVYDFCIIASDEDMGDAQSIKHALESQLSIRGCMFADVCSPGKDVIDCYEDMMDKSCKILFLITNNFLKDKFSRRLQNAAVFQCLVEKASKSSLEKCVPVFRHSEQLKVRIPLGLRGISGIRYHEVSDANLYRQYFVGISQSRVRLHERMFKKYCVEYVTFRVDEFLKTLQEEQLAIENAESRLAELALQRNKPPPLRQISSSSLMPQSSSSQSRAVRELTNSSSQSRTVRELTEVLSALNPAQMSSEVSCQQMLNGASVSVQGDRNHFGTRNEINVNIVIHADNKEEDSSDDSE